MKWCCCQEVGDVSGGVNSLIEKDPCKYRKDPPPPFITRDQYKIQSSHTTFVMSTQRLSLALLLRSTSSPFSKYYLHSRDRLNYRNLHIHTSTHWPFDTISSFAPLSRSQHKVPDLSNALNDLNLTFPINTALYFHSLWLLCYTSLCLQSEQASK